MSRSREREDARRSPTIVLALFFGLIAIVVALGGLLSMKAFETRGLPDSLPEPVSHADLRLGVNVDLEQYDDDALEETLAEIKDSGFSAVKQSFYYSDRPFDWRSSDRLIDAVSGSGLALVPLLDGDPANDFAPPDDPGRFADWAGAFAGRYGDQIEHYVVWDEPNLTSHWGMRPINAADYAALLSAAASAIRDADPSAVIVAAPLAPTVETGDRNLADSLYLEALYQAGAAEFFDVVAGKPYGFDSGPDDRRVALDVLNFSHVILLREVMERYGDDGKSIWAGNWGWNALPNSWSGSPSIWGQVDEETQVVWTANAVERVRNEWPWMGHMFLENWQPEAPADDPIWGFNIAGRPEVQATAQLANGDELAYPGFHAAADPAPGQQYAGLWRFSPQYGADVGMSGDQVTFNFWGTDVGLRVRKADYNIRFHVTVDGEPANALPRDELGAALVLNSADPAQESLSVETVARGLEPGEHTLTATAQRESDQWALSGFGVGYQPTNATLQSAIIMLTILAVLVAILIFIYARRTDWRPWGQAVQLRYDNLGRHRQLLFTSLAAVSAAIAGWLTWSEQATGLIRKIGDGGQLAVTAVAASTFYFAPSLLVYLVALALLFGLIYLRPQWGLALIAFSIPFFVKPKPMLGYRFSPVEVFVLLTLAAFTLRFLVQRWASTQTSRPVANQTFRLRSADYAALTLILVATVSLFFTERLEVATNEWRVLIVESVIFYLLMRWMWLSDKETWTILDAYILGGVAVALIGLWQYATGQNLITSEGGLMRLRSVYGSPNNAALFLGRMVPLLIAFLVMGTGRRRIAYGLALVPVGLAMLLSFSKGALFLGLPAALLVVLILWRRSVRGRLWPWLLGFALAGIVALFIALQIPQLVGRLNPQGATGFFRMNLWQSSWNMFVDHPIFGVGLDNFLYEYRGRYIMDAAWQEPNLSHPHNIFLDFATRLGLAGILVGVWLLWSYAGVSIRLPSRVSSAWRPLAVGLVGALVYTLAHGLVDHSFFLVDLAFTFFLMLGLAVWLDENQSAG